MTSHHLNGFRMRPVHPDDASMLIELDTVERLVRRRHDKQHTDVPEHLSSYAAAVVMANIPTPPEGVTPVVTIHGLPNDSQTVPGMGPTIYDDEGRTLVVSQVMVPAFRTNMVDLDLRATVEVGDRRIEFDGAHLRFLGDRLILSGGTDDASIDLKTARFWEPRSHEHALPTTSAPSSAAKWGIV